MLFAVFLFMVDVKFHIRNGRTAGSGGGEGNDVTAIEEGSGGGW